MVSITISTATKSYQGTDARCDKKEISPLFEIARFLVRFNHVASLIVNANHGVMRSTAKLRVTDCVQNFGVP
jgi:hypothetical protein